MTFELRMRMSAAGALAVLLCGLLMLVAPSSLAAEAADRLGLPDFTRLVASRGAAVVNISATQAPAQPQKQPFRLPELDESDPMFEFFRKFIPRMPEYPGAEPDDKSLGSGFIISADGYILTNAHVVEAAESIVVRLADKREFDATVIGADARSDVALIRIEAKELPHVVLGDPEALAVGEWVLAIGSPFGFEQSVTAGIVSAKGRSLPDENFVPFIQTDVAINPGQLRWSALQPAWRGRRHQLADLQPHRRFHGAVVRDPDRRGDGRAAAAAREGQGGARAHRRFHSGDHP